MTNEPTPIRGLTLQSVAELRHGFNRINADEFAEVLKKSIGADRHYAEVKYAEFQRDPIAYCASRHPITQGEALFQLALSKAGP